MKHNDIKIMLVDDSSTMIRILLNVLEQAGFENVVTANNGSAALDILKSQSDIHLVLCDWNMPLMTGLSLLKEIRSDEKLKNFPFIMVTSRNSKADIFAAIESGANDFIVKPFNTRTITQKIDDVLGVMD